MGKMKNAGENGKKAAGNSKKQAAAAKKQAELDAKQAAAEDELWSQGANTKLSKKEQEAAKREEARRKKAERDAELEAETAAASKKKPQINQKKANSLDDALRASSLEAHNIDDAIAALEIATGTKTDKIERHPERRFKPALSNYEDERLASIREENPGLRLNQLKQLIFEEFKKSPMNPFNQPHLRFNASKQEILEALQAIQAAKEKKLQSNI